MAALRRFDLPDSPGLISRLTSFEDFGSNPGSLNAKAYVPETAVSGLPLVVVLHGCTQTAAGYDRGAGWTNAADEHGFVLLFPEQQRANNPNLCFNWFSPGDASRDRGEALSIRQMVAEMHARNGTDPARVFVTGLSAGGAMAAVMLATYPDVFAGGAVIAGLPFGSAQSVPEAFDRMRGHGGPGAAKLSEIVRSASNHPGPWPTLSVWHGSGDMTVDSSNAKDLVDQWRALHNSASAPDRTDTVEGYPHRVWCEAGGREVIEEYVITGMAHGTPVSAARTEFGETAGPYMLEAGISSTRHICRFWGLSNAPSSALSAATQDNFPTAPAREPPQRARPPESPVGGVTKTIEDALRTAGLMR